MNVQRKQQVQRHIKNKERVSPVRVDQKSQADDKSLSSYINQINKRSSGLAGHSATNHLQQDAVLQLQQRCGNSCVQRTLIAQVSSGNEDKIQHESRENETISNETESGDEQSHAPGCGCATCK